VDFSNVEVVIAALDEEKGIGPTISEMKEILKGSRFVVVDGYSIDRTVEIAKDLGAEVFFQNGMGKGDAISMGLAHLNADTRYVVFTDADYTYPAGHLKEMIGVLESDPNVGMVLGDRFNRTYESISDRNQFYMGNRILGFVQGIINGVRLNDPFTGLRVIRYDLLKGWSPKSEGFDIEAELNHRVNNSGYKIVEVPIHYRKRLGKKKLGFRHGLEIFKRILLESF
jgi:glycosyltransferase involved in cell wall biosynthesis